MTRKPEYKSSIPEIIYIVSSEKTYRIFVVEGQAIRYQQELLDANKKALIITYQRQRA